MSAITKIGTAIAGLVGRLFGKTDESVRTAELHAQVELTEAQAFEHGRVAPRYVFQYVLAAVFGLSAVVILVDLSFPGLFPGAPAARLNEALVSWGDFFLSVFGE